jgi:hypothetical protein
VWQRRETIISRSATLCRLKTSTEQFHMRTVEAVIIGNSGVRNMARCAQPIGCLSESHFDAKSQ